MAESEKNQKSEEQLVVFQLAEETYGIDISLVHEIIRMQAITEIPRTPEFVEGVINLRGRVIPVIDLHKRFELPPSEETQHSRIMVVEVNGMTVGMIVDSVSEVLRLPAVNIDPPPPVFSGIDAAYLRGVGKVGEQLIILLEMDRILREKEKQELVNSDFEEVASASE